MGAFDQSSAVKRPSRYMVARLKEAENRGESDSGNVVFGLKFVPPDGGREERYYLAFRPTWLDKDLEPDNLPSEKGNNQKFLHQKNFGGQNGVSPVAAILGESFFDELTGELETQGTLSSEKFFDYFEDAVQRNNMVGLILRQESETVELASGKTKRILQDRLKVDAFFGPGEVDRINKYIAGDMAKKEADDDYQAKAVATWEIDPDNPELSANPFETAGAENVAETEEVAVLA